MGRAIDPELMRRVAAGEYVVDPQAVAEAILQRGRSRREARRLSRMLVSGEVDRLAPRPDDPDTHTGLDPA